MTRRSSVDELIEVLEAFRFPLDSKQAWAEVTVDSFEEESNEVAILRSILEKFVFPIVMKKQIISPIYEERNELSEYKFPARRGTIGSDITKRVILPKLQRILSCHSLCSVPRQESPNMSIASQRSTASWQETTVHSTTATKGSFDELAHQNLSKVAKTKNIYQPEQEAVLQ